MENQKLTENDYDKCADYLCNEANKKGFKLVKFRLEKI